uniref:Putative nucleolar protein gar2-related protein n=1 Tax=Tanacetum cinerariifolium TaxID=118510 RepID=A0A6L2LFA1_TANCI|nr:putative nucleolar protein gar2-related protein [Tanacetum cinerariifolium]
MKQTDKKKKSTLNNQTKRSVRSQNRDNKLQQEKANQPSKPKNADTNASSITSDTNIDDTQISEEASQNIKTLEPNGQEIRDDDESDSETVTDSVSSSGDSRATEEEKLETVPLVSQKPSKKDDSENSFEVPRGKSDRESRLLQPTAASASKKITNSSKASSNGTTKRVVKVHPKLSSAPPSVSSEGFDDQTSAEPKGEDILDDDEIVDDPKAKEALDQKIEDMETRIEKLEEELREVAALEISLYSVVPEHGSSAHKVHTPARRLSRLYIHAAKHYSQGKRATIAKNTASGLVLIAKSCGNDVPRLTFWWSNTIVLREIITQAFGSSCQSSLLTKVVNSNGSSKQLNKPDFMEFMDDWQGTRTFTSALEKVESWIFSRIVESIWWQTLTPKMQSLGDDTNTNNGIGRLLGPASGNQQQGNLSINLWRIAFHDAFKRLCPVRAGGHECGCLPVLARMVMEQCVARLDVAMFNAILRESAHEMPTDPVSDPIVESRVLPIPAGDLSFGSGAQLKNAVGNWSRWLSDWFGMDTEDEHTTGEDDDSEKDGRGDLKCFHLLNALSDLLMLPKDMLMDTSVRTEVCPSISLPLLKRILCNFTPDEFCPDSVPGAVLEAVNAESIIESRLSGDNSSSFPYAAAPVIYKPPSSTAVSHKVSEAGGKSLGRNASVVQRKGYTSDEELEELDSPLSSIIDKLPSSPTVARNGNVQHVDQTTHVAVNARYELLREVWLS